MPSIRQLPVPKQAIVEQGLIVEPTDRKSYHISVVYPSAEFKASQDSAVSTQSSLHAEAEEHYQLIRTITKENLLGYKKWLSDINARKKRVRKSLEKGAHWAAIRHKIGLKGSQ